MSLNGLPELERKSFPGEVKPTQTKDGYLLVRIRVLLLVAYSSVRRDFAGHERALRANTPY